MHSEPIYIWSDRVSLHIRQLTFFVDLGTGLTSLHCLNKTLSTRVLLWGQRTQIVGAVILNRDCTHDCFK